MLSHLRPLALFITALIIALIVGASPAHAIVDINAGYSILNSSPSQLNAFAPTVNTSTIKNEGGLSGDIRLSLPGMPFGLGARYEDWTKKATSAANEVDASYRRISVLVDKRFIDTIIYIGVLGTVGLSNEFKYEVHNDQTYKASGGVTGSAALEAGLNLGIFTVGAEVGYLYAPISNLKNNNGTQATNSGANVKVDLSGTYGRLTVGLSI